MERYGTRDLASNKCLANPELVSNVIVPPCQNAGSTNDAMQRCLSFVENIRGQDLTSLTSASSPVNTLLYSDHTCRNLQFVQFFGYVFMIVSAATILFIFLF